MKEAVIKMDKAFEYVGNNVRSGLEDFLRVKEMTAKKIITVIMLPLDIYGESVGNQIFYASWYLVLLFLSQYDIKKTNNTGGVKILRNNDIDIIMRPIIFYTCLFAPLVVEEINLIGVYFYLIRTYHDTDDRGIKNWIKAKIKTLKESLKKGDTEPVPA